MSTYKPRKLTKEIVLRTKQLLLDGNDIDIVCQMLGFTRDTADMWAKTGRELRAEEPDWGVEEWVAWADGEEGNLTPAFSFALDAGYALAL